MMLAWWFQLRHLLSVGAEQNEDKNEDRNKIMGKDKDILLIITENCELK